jgi:hypothetical protein
MTLKYFTINYDLMPPGTPWAFSDANNFVPSYNFPNHTGFTAHHAILYTNNPQLTVASATVRAVFGQTGGANLPQIQFRALHYDASNNAVWENVGSVLTQNPAYTVDNQATGCTSTIQGWSGTFYRQVGFEAKGIGYIYGARLEIVYKMDDHSEVLGDLSSRVAALEAQ